VATVVGILDRDCWSARIDNIVIADPATKMLTWVPRGLWCPSLHDSINKAFGRGGVERLLFALRELEFPCDYGLVLRRGATERAAAHISVEVPVKEPLDFWYPIHPTKPIEDGRRVVSFRPPLERLEGERIHEWVGARMGIAREGFGHEDSDLYRIARQQVFLGALLKQRFDFRVAVADKNLMRVYGDPLSELARVDASWRMQTVDNVRVITVEGKMRLLKAGAPEPSSRRTSASRARSSGTTGKRQPGKVPRLAALGREIKRLFRDLRHRHRQK
jgi:hypothetical protein